MKKKIVVISLLLVLVLLGGCAQREITTLEIYPPRTSVQVFQPTLFSVSAYDQNGKWIEINNPKWTLDPPIGTLETIPRGMNYISLEGQIAGETTLKVEDAGVVYSVDLTITQEVTPPTGLAVDATMQYNTSRQGDSPVLRFDGFFQEGSSISDYRLYRSLSENGPFTKVEYNVTYGDFPESLFDGELEIGSTYYYAVNVEQENKYSGLSERVAVTIGNPITWNYPSTPDNGYLTGFATWTSDVDYDTYTLIFYGGNPSDIYRFTTTEKAFRLFENIPAGEYWWVIIGTSGDGTSQYQTAISAVYQTTFQ